jgi:peptide/nickel transport system substrate-binding protein
LVPARLAAESLNMAPAKGLAEYKEKFVTDRFIGTGPYRLAEIAGTDRVVLEANAGYWGTKSPSPRIVWQVIPDAATRVAALQRGDIDVMLNLPLPLAPTVEGDPNLRVYAELSSLTHGILLNARESPPLKDRRVRQALNMAVDRQAIIKNLFNGRGQLLNTVTGRNVTNTFDPGPYPYDPPRAKQLLAEAGHANGLEIQLWQSIGRWTLAEEMAQVIAGYWDKVGVKTKLQVLEWAEYNKRSGASQLKDAFYYAFINGTWDASYTVQRFKPDFASFRYFDASGDLLKAIRDYEQTFDPKRRKELAAQALKGLHDEAVWVFLWQLEQLTGVSKKVKGFKIRPDDFIWARDAYVEA